LVQRFYSIAEVAAATRVSATTIRSWEREGFLLPQRTRGGHRLYTDSDVQRVHRIRHLRRGANLSADSIKRQLGPASNAPGAASSRADGNLGARLRASRLRRGLSLARAAGLTGLSASFLSAVELGQSGISLESLGKLAATYQVTVAGLQARRSSAPQAVQSPGARPRYVVDDGRVTVEDLVDQPLRLRGRLIEAVPGGGSGGAHQGQGDEELVYVLSGNVSFWIGYDRRYDLSSGDALHLASAEPRDWKNIGATIASLLWVSLTPAGED
jgi:DNA-binding transcriptional MerR regulator/quercetin dioxygenase-like cupin family protein